MTAPSISEVIAFATTPKEPIAEVPTEERVAIGIMWGETAIVDPAVILDGDNGHERYYAVPRSLADDFIATERRLAVLREQITACPRYRIMPARKLMLGDDLVAERTMESPR